MTGLPRKFLTPFLLLAAASSLAACTTTAPGHDQRMAKVNAALQNYSAEKSTPESLAALEQSYKRSSGDSAVALRYAHALRQQNYFNRAGLILEPFASGKDVNDPAILIEYASILASLGSYKESEEYARKAVIAAPESGQAYHVLGIALDAQGHHPQAQVAFEKGLERWEGNPSAILNNIGLNLAAQGFLDEALETLRKAMDTAPDRMEIERNIRIVSALQYQPPVEGTRLVPKPPRKPEKPDPVAGDPQLQPDPEPVAEEEAAAEAAAEEPAGSAPVEAVEKEPAE